MMSLGLRIICAFAALLACTRAAAGTPESGYPVNGRVIDRLTRRPVAYAAVVPVGQEQRGVSTDSAGRFTLRRVRPGIHRLSASSVGYEELRSSAEGRSYGVEAMARWQIPGKVNLVGSVTLFRSEYRRDSAAPYIVSAWDSRFVVNLSGTYDLPRSWSVGARLSAVGGTPYTPYDVGKSSLVEAWDAQGRPYYDYARYNDGRLDAFAQLDLRIDKTFYFRHCMLGLYIDLQNVTGSKLRQPDVLMSTGVVENPEAPAAEQRYRMKYIRQESGTLIPTLGITVEF